jgi:hypothetical protein
MFFAVCFIFSWAIYHRPKNHSLTLAKRNLINSQKGQQSFSEHPVSDEEASAMLDIIEAITKCRRAYGPLTKRALYLAIAAVALLFAVFSPNSIWMRLGIILVLLIILTLLVYAALKPLRSNQRSDKALTASFEAWAKEHPELTEKRPKADSKASSASQRGYVSSIPATTYPTQSSDVTSSTSPRHDASTTSDDNWNGPQQPWQ